MAAPTINYVEYTLSLKKDSYKVEAVEFRIWETAKAMLKKLKRYIEVIEKILEHERGVLRVETFNAGQDLVNQYYAKLKQTKVPFNLTDRKGIKIFAANLERGHEVLVQESTDKDRPSVVARIREDANKLSPEPSQPPQPPQQPQPQILDRATKMVGDMGDEIGLQPIRGSPDVEADSLVSLQVKTHEGAPAFYVLFDLADLIHSGGYGKVYRVHKKGDPNTIYAMKIAKGGAAALQDLEREKLIWQDLKHEHILPLLGTTPMTGKGLGLLSPFIEERDLARARRNPKYAYSEGELITLLRQTSDALEYVHGAGVIHGDIKPENILVTSDKKALLCDFGLSKNLHFVDTGPNHVGAGSGSFVATELRAGYSSGIHEQKSKESDIFAFGKTMAQVISGEPQDTPLPSRPSTLQSGPGQAVWALAEHCCGPRASRPDIKHVASTLRLIEQGSYPIS